jgi:hypothetical protein
MIDDVRQQMPQYVLMGEAFSGFVLDALIERRVGQ